jgi:hypothetical protein
MRTPNSALAFAVAFLFLWQTVIVHTHIHLPSSGSHRLAAAASNAPLFVDGAADHTNHEQSPGKHSGHCALCQHAARTGVFVASAFVWPSVRMPHFEAHKEFAPSSAVNITSHIWRGRAPPAA